MPLKANRLKLKPSRVKSRPDLTAYFHSIRPGGQVLARLWRVGSSSFIMPRTSIAVKNSHAPCPESENLFAYLRMSPFSHNECSFTIQALAPIPPL